MAQIDIKNATIRIKDGGSNAIEVKIGEGNLSWTEHKARQYYKDRGRLDTVRDGDEEPVDLKLDATWEFIKADSGDTPTILDVLKQRGEAAGWVTTASDTCEPYCVDIEIIYSPPCLDQLNETILFSDFRYEQIDQDLRAGTISLTGKCNVVEPTVTRTAQTT